MLFSCGIGFRFLFMMDFWWWELFCVGVGFRLCVCILGLKDD